MTKRQADRLRNEHTLAHRTVGKILPCGHEAKGGPISETRSHSWYRCSQGCELQRIRRSTPP